jgi:hypothetical protein
VEKNIIIKYIIYKLKTNFLKKTKKTKNQKKENEEKREKEKEKERKRRKKEKEKRVNKIKLIKIKCLGLLKPGQYRILFLKSSFIEISENNL